MKGNLARWSLKETIQNKFPIRLIDIEEALRVCFGPGGDGSTPIWAARTAIGDFIVMRKEDFKLLQTGHIKLINETRPKVAEREARARIPALLRENGD